MKYTSLKFIYIPQKTIRSGLRCICAVTIFFFLCSIIKCSQIKKMNKVVKDLVVNFKYKNHKVYIDNFYCKAELFNNLKKREFIVVERQVGIGVDQINLNMKKNTTKKQNNC
ncbi:hypothetical protein CDIK_1180 [Cucumispora dikerogammari]|nr:hypothetical protein CDIK_1180 [Cucumispora dikerogammari]